VRERREEGGVLLMLERNEKQGPSFGLIGKIMSNYQLVLFNFHLLLQSVVVILNYFSMLGHLISHLGSKINFYLILF
jgi:hypothetical protein